MQKTKLGITIGMLSAVVYFTALAGGYLALFLLVGLSFVVYAVLAVVCLLAATMKGGMEE